MYYHLVLRVTLKTSCHLMTTESLFESMFLIMCETRQRKNTFGFGKKGSKHFSCSIDCF